MDPESRAQIADHLGIRHRAESVGDPEAEAWEIISRRLKGLQARAEAWPKTISARAPNRSWRQILEVVAKKLEVPFDKSDDEATLEARLFEHAASEMIGRMSHGEREEIAAFEAMEPGLIARIRAMGVGTSGTKLIVSGLFKAATRGGFDTYTTAVKVAAWLNRSLGTRIVMSTATQGLKVVLRSVNVALWLWLVSDVMNWLFGKSEARILPVVIQIHIADITQRLA
jgi:uncharacterized protein YaaW (UPF0174 family)